MSELCEKLHRHVQSLSRYQFSFEEQAIPLNGIFLMFEKGERAHQGDRIVLVGSHTGADQLRSRLMQHFLKENKDRSILRKNIGRSLLNRSNDKYLKIWDLDLISAEGKRMYKDLVVTDYQQQVEKQVTQYMQRHFSFSVIEIPEKKERHELKSKIISTVSICKGCQSSTNWLGLSSPIDKIRESGLWQVNELYKTALSVGDLDRLVGA